MITLTPDQQRALVEIQAVTAAGERHLLTGYAGSGKTTLMQAYARAAQDRRQRIILTAPTHKAVAVLLRKLREAGISDVPCRTIHSLLSLSPKVQGDRQVFSRKKNADPVTEDIVVIDECSMVSADLMVFIKRHLQQSFVLFVGDPAQLPPVGEVASQTFDTKSRSHLETIIRQAEGHPILDAAQTIRLSQGKAMDWSWCKSKSTPPYGIFRPSDAEMWMRKAFTSDEFAADPDSHRYLCWTNKKVADVNRKVRQWRYGDNIPTPFVAGERALFRGPVVIDNSILVNTNEEADVLSIDRDVFQMHFSTRDCVDGWTAELPAWRVEVRKTDGTKLSVHMAADDGALNKALDRLTDEAGDCKTRWGDRHALQNALAKLQSIYALTVHTSQGSTFKNAFIDVPDIRRRVESNTLEAQQLFYVAATRPTHALMLIGAP